MKRSLFQAACVAIPKGLGGVLAVVLNGFLLTRMPPAEFGVYALCLTLVALTDGVVGAAIDMSAVKLASARRAHDMAGALAIERWAVLIKLAAGTLVVCAVVPFASPLSQAFFHRPDPQVLLVAIATAAGVLLMRSIFLHLQLGERFLAYAGVELLAQSLRVLGILSVIAWFSVSALTLAIAALAGTVIAIVGGAWIAGVQLKGPKLRWADGRELLMTLRWMATTLAVSALMARVDLLLLAHWSSIDQVGVFAAAQVFAQIPELLGWYLAVVFGPKVVPADASGTLPGMMRRVQGGLMVLVLAAGCATILALQLVGDSLPAAYARSADVLLPLMAGSLAGMCALPVTVPYIMFIRPKYIFLFDLISLPFLLLAYKLAIDAAGAMGAAWVSGGARVAKATLLQTCAWLWAKQRSSMVLSTSR